MKSLFQKSGLTLLLMLVMLFTIQSESQAQANNDCIPYITNVMAVEGGYEYEFTRTCLTRLGWVTTVYTEFHENPIPDGSSEVGEIQIWSEKWYEDDNGVPSTKRIYPKKAKNSKLKNVKSKDAKVFQEVCEEAVFVETVLQNGEWYDKYSQQCTNGGSSYTLFTLMPVLESPDGSGVITNVVVTDLVYPTCGEWTSTGCITNHPDGTQTEEYERACYLRIDDEWWTETANFPIE